MSRAFDLIGAQHNEADRPGQVAATAWVAEHAHGERVVLDVGCGSGIPTAKMLADTGCCVVGADSSTTLLELARRNVPGGIFVEREPHDLSGLHPRQGRFDGACAFSLRLLDRAGVAKALDSVRAVLAAEAVFALDIAGEPGELARLLSHHGFSLVNLISEETHRYMCCRVTPVM